MDKSSSNHLQNFALLGEIVTRFHNVPYDQFQKELENWFIENIKNQGVDVENLTEEESLIFEQVFGLTKAIYHQAEVLQTLVDLKIQPHNNED